jgi:hypothetical protein
MYVMIRGTGHSRNKGTTLKIVLYDRRSKSDQLKMDQSSITQRLVQASLAKHEGPINQRVASQARTHTRANERAVTALDRKRVVPNPELSIHAGVRGFVVCILKNDRSKTKFSMFVTRRDTKPESNG